MISNAPRQNHDRENQIQTMHHSILRSRVTARCFPLWLGVVIWPLLLAAPTARASADRISRYNVVWESPSPDASGQMPLGNGDIAAGVYALEDGDLYLLLSKNDAFTYNGDLFKTGRVRISLKPNPFAKGKPFRQTLDLPTGSIRLEADNVRFRVWADAYRPVYHVQIESRHELAVTAEPDLWQRIDGCAWNKTAAPIDPPTQDVRLERQGRIIWYFAVGDRSVFPTEMKFYDVPEMIGRFPDPYRFNTFGNLLESPDLKLENGTLRGRGKTFDIRIHALTKQTPKQPKQAKFGVPPSGGSDAPPAKAGTPYFRVPPSGGSGARPTALGVPPLVGSDAQPAKAGTPNGGAETSTMNWDWISAIEQQANQPLNVKQDWAAHCRWWSNFWERGWILASDNTLPSEEREQFSGEGYTAQRSEPDGAGLVAQSYNVFRFLMACQSRGRIQVKFNGGIVTQPLRYKSKPRLVAVKRQDGTWISHEDDRLWGRRFTYQNQRLLYWPLLMSGDFDLMQPFFDYYWHLLPVRKAITKAWFGHAGAYYRENIEPTGGERDCSKNGQDRETKPLKTPPGGNKGDGYYHSYYFTSGLETLAMMLQYVKWTGDTAFRDRVVTPFAREVLLFYDQHYPRDANGKLRLDPIQVLETWWVAVNSAPDVAGLHFCLNELLATPAGAASDRANWQRLRRELPPVPMQEIDSRKALAPADTWSNRRNSENGELYPVFPFELFGLGHGTKELVEWTMLHRSNPNRFGYKCWTQDQIHWAYAGHAVEAMDGLVHRFRWASPLCRFPLYGSEGPDSCPDFDHFGSGSIALQRMLVQEANGKILLLPAWPATWDADFKLHLSGRTTISGKVANGRLVEWDVQPAARRKDVVLFEPQPVPERPVIPANKHPLRIGIASDGQSRFQGQIGRVTVFRGLLKPEQIRALAKGNRQQELEGPNVAVCRLNPRPGDTLPVKPDDLSSPVTFEAWINPAAKESGRIFDKITAGTDDGLLIDCWPGLALRVIAGSVRKDLAEVLKPNVWQHITVLLGKGHVAVFLNGRRL